MSILIDKEFESLIPPLSAEEFQQLEENCLRDGIRDALIVWEQDGNDILIDGHNRFRIVGKHPTIHFDVKRMQFANRNEAIRWIILNQFGRRNLSAYDRSILALKLKPMIAEKAKEQQVRKSVSQKSVEQKPIDTQKELAKVAGVSHDTIHKVEAIQKSGNEQLIKDVREGRESINSGYQRIHPKKTPAQSNKEFIEQAKQEHEAFQNNKTVSIHEAQMDKANRQIIASNVYARLLNMGLRINDIAHDMEEGNIDLKEMCKEIDPARIKALKQTIRVTYEQLMRIDKELNIG
jgi:DNA-binding XRE family transcriptional regulator